MCADRTPAARNGNEGKNQGGGNGLMLGQLSVIVPQFGELQVYIKRDETLGAAFLSEESGCKYGVSLSVLNWFGEPGQRKGWGYVNIVRLVAFRFLEQPRVQVPPDWVALRSDGMDLCVHPSLHRHVPITDGGWVAFRAERKPAVDRSRDKIRISALFPLDAEHPGIVAGLALAGALNSQDHADMLRRLLGDMAASTLSDHVRRQWPDALSAIAAVEGLPADLQAQARAQRTRLQSQPPRTAPTVGSASPGQPAARRADRPMLPEAGRSSGVQRVNLEL